MAEGLAGTLHAAVGRAALPKGVGYPPALAGKVAASYIAFVIRHTKYTEWRLADVTVRA